MLMHPSCVRRAAVRSMIHSHSTPKLSLRPSSPIRPPWTPSHLLPASLFSPSSAFSSSPSLSTATAVNNTTATSPSIQSPSLLSTSNLNPRVISAQYAVRGELVLKAEQMKVAIAKAKADGKPSPYPFKTIVHCNIGNPQELGQPPLVFHRQVLALAHYPAAVEGAGAASAFAADAIERAKHYLSEVPSTGSYTNSMGIRKVREEVATFITARDGHPVPDPDAIFLTDGASTGVKNIMTLLIRDENDAVLTPIPQYPLYSATLSILGGTGIGYYLDEERCWSLDIDELQRAVDEGRAAGKNVRALVVINPGNPTGQVLSEDDMREVVRFCERESIILLADEVYQENVYDRSSRFVSFKKVVCDLKANVHLISFHSTSKGFIGECGQRGGYMELHNIPDDVTQQVYKLASISLCSNTSGQLMTGLMVNPPKQGQPSYEHYRKQRDDVLNSLAHRALLVAKTLNSCTNITCQPVQGAMYAFPRIHLPPAALRAAEQAGKAADTFYCLRLLEETGLVTVPGSGFGQRDNEWHFRMTILPREEQLTEVLERFRMFNDKFMLRYADGGSEGAQKEKKQ